MSRSYSQYIIPSAKKFLQRSASLEFRPKGSTVSLVSRDSSTGTTRYALTVPSSSGFSSRFASLKSRFVNLSTLTMISPPSRSRRRLATSAAGFIATSTSAMSPGVKMSWLANWIWNPDTPARVPAGARISAG